MSEPKKRENWALIGGLQAGAVLLCVAWGHRMHVVTPIGRVGDASVADVLAVGLGGYVCAVAIGLVVSSILIRPWRPSAWLLAWSVITIGVSALVLVTT